MRFTNARGRIANDDVTHPPDMKSVAETLLKAHEKTDFQSNGAFASTSIQGPE